MTKPAPLVPALSESGKALVRSMVAEAELQTLRRARGYLARGRPLAGLPLIALRT